MRRNIIMWLLSNLQSVQPRYGATTGEGVINLFLSSAYTAVWKSLPGAIVNVSSVAARSARLTIMWIMRDQRPLDTMTIGLSKELGPQGIRVNAVRPGLIETERQSSWDSSARRLSTYGAMNSLHCF